MARQKHNHSKHLLRRKDITQSRAGGAAAAAAATCSNQFKPVMSCMAVAGRGRKSLPQSAGGHGTILVYKCVYQSCRGSIWS